MPIILASTASQPKGMRQKLKTRENMKASTFKKFFARGQADAAYDLK